MLSGNPIFLSVSSLVREEIEKAKKEVDMDVKDSQLGIWKKEYRV